MSDPSPRFDDVRDRIEAILKRKLPALAARVYVDRQWPTGVDALPTLLVESGPERKTLAGPHGHPEYDVTATLAVSIRVQARTEVLALATMDPLVRAVEQALLAQPDALADLPGFGTVTSVSRAASMGSDGDRIEAQVSLAFECTWTEEYPPDAPDDLLRARIVLDAIDPADPNGPYVGITGFPPPAAPPRATGPDGRAEIGADITFPV